jgi:hypothetical protein
MRAVRQQLVGQSALATFACDVSVEALPQVFAHPHLPPAYTTLADRFQSQMGVM